MMQLYNVFLSAGNREVLIFSIGFAIIAISLSLMSLVLELVSKFYRTGRRGRILQIVDILNPKNCRSIFFFVGCYKLFNRSSE